MKKINLLVVAVFMSLSVTCLFMVVTAEANDDIDQAVAKAIVNETCVNMALFSEKEIQEYFEKIFVSIVEMDAWADKIEKRAKRYGAKGEIESNRIKNLVQNSFREDFIQFMTPVGVSLTFYKSGKQNCELPAYSSSENFHIGRLQYNPFGNQKLKLK